MLTGFSISDRIDAQPGSGLGAALSQYKKVDNDTHRDPLVNSGRFKNVISAGRIINNVSTILSFSEGRSRMLPTNPTGVNPLSPEQPPLRLDVPIFGRLGGRSYSSQETYAQKLASSLTSVGSERRVHGLHDKVCMLHLSYLSPQKLKMFSLFVLLSDAGSTALKRFLRLSSYWRILLPILRDSIAALPQPRRSITLIIGTIVDQARYHAARKFSIRSGSKMRTRSCRNGRTIEDVGATFFHWEKSNLSAIQDLFGSHCVSLPFSL
jgi:hypothetical protein